jgi:hypothetical protein
VPCISAEHEPPLSRKSPPLISIKQLAPNAPHDLLQSFAVLCVSRPGTIEPLLSLIPLGYLRAAKTTHYLSLPEVMLVLHFTSLRALEKAVSW